MEQIKVVGFDCDGVMFDTKNANIAYYNRILEHFGKPEMTSEQFEFTHTHTVYESIEYLFQGNLDKINAVHEVRKQISYMPFLKLMEIEPYLKPLLKTLRPEHKTAVATNRTDTITSVLFEHNLQEYFDFVVSALDVEKPKPYPDPIIRILNHFQVEPGEMIYIGDSELDQIASKSAGVFFIAYKNPGLYADFHITSLKEINQILF